MAKPKKQDGKLVDVILRHRVKHDGETYEPKERASFPQDVAETLLRCKAAELAPATEELEESTL